MKEYVLILEPSGEVAREISEGIHSFGYAVKGVRAAAELSTITERPSVLLAATTLASDYVDFVKHLNAFQSRFSPRVPVVFISRQGDFDTRITALRIGGDGFLTHPLNVSQLVDMLDNIGSVEEQEPYRLLVVEDDEDMAVLYKQLLKEAGVEVEWSSQPNEIIAKINEFQPDVILMDLYLSEGLLGTEVSRLIRQYENAFSIPVVFVSAERDEQARVEAYLHGAEAFLQKPVKPANLRAAIVAKARRSRELRALTSQDSFTGLLNKRHIQATLHLEVNRAERSGDDLSIAMIDIDHFKKVNDTRGHSAGDNVIKGLARLLRESYRRTDFLGRFGGEEFLIILPRTSGEEACRLNNQLREHFSTLLHYASDEDEFSCTLSCGVAQFKRGLEWKTLLDQADQALYQAKEAGRNQVKLA